jgi:hypothetical protein
MSTRRGRLTALAVWLVVLAGPAHAAGKGDPQGAMRLGFGLILFTPMVQFLLAILLPRFTMRVQRAVRTGFWPSAGWGALVVVLTIILALILKQGGAAGNWLAALIGMAVLLAAQAGGLGIAKIIGDWALRRWNVEPIGPLSVLCGATVWAWGACVPLVGWVAGFFTLLVSLGAAIQVLLQPTHFEAPPELVVPPAPSADQPAPP